MTTGDHFAGYTIRGVLGSGGMGEVYRVRHPRLPRDEALKVLRADISGDPDFQARFIREADLAAGLSHPHIVAVHDRGDSAGQLWIAMEYIDGTDAAKLLARSTSGLPIEMVLPIITAVADALDYAHRRGVLHRDVKPANILCAETDSESQRIYLSDFGIARDLDQVSGLTATNMTVGTIAYSAPEQLMGETLDGRVDQYSLAATAFHLLAGAEPFPSTNAAVAIAQHLNADRPRLSSIRADLSGLDDVLATGMAKEPQHRYPSCLDFARALERAALGAEPYPHDALTQAAPITPAAAATAEAPALRDFPAAGGVRAGMRRWWGYLAAAAAVLVTALALVWRPWQHESPSGAAPPPQSQTKDTAQATGAGTGRTALAAAEAIKAAIPSITQLVELTEATDDNSLLGRPNGYTAAVVLIDPRSRGLCDPARPGVDCGATVEQWPSQAAAQARADYIRNIRAASPILGSEWTTVSGDLLLRVTGELTPSTAKSYENAFTD